MTTPHASEEFLDDIFFVALPFQFVRLYGFVSTPDGKQSKSAKFLIDLISFTWLSLLAKARTLRFARLSVSSRRCRSSSSSCSGVILKVFDVAFERTYQLNSRILPVAVRFFFK